MTITRCSRFITLEAFTKLPLWSGTFEQSRINGLKRGLFHKSLMAFQVLGGEHDKATVSSARLKVTAYGKKRFVIALKYAGESDYRHLVATDMTWPPMDITQSTL